MRPALLLTILLAGCASPGLVYKPVEIRLLEDRCSSAKVNGILPKMIRPQYVEGFKDARLFWNGRWWEACWTEMEGRVFVIDEEGEVFNGYSGILKALFRKE